jgi:uncharacterized SAM-binding protein YcdF (DUF218 family)
LAKAFRFLLQTAGALALLGLVLGAGLVLSAGLWLPVRDELAPADAIVVLAGDPRRAIFAADLHHKGLAPAIYIGRPVHDPPQAMCELGFPCPRQEDVMLEVLRRKGVPAEAVRVYGQDLMSTVEEAENLGRALGPEARRLIVVTSPYHCRRAGLILARALPGREISMAPTPYERFDVKWWAHQGSASAVVSETAKFLFYFLGTPFRSHPAR